jgi:hypothetical protein
MAPPARTLALVVAPMLARWAAVVQCYGGLPRPGATGMALLAGRARFREFGIASVTALGTTLILLDAVGLAIGRRVHPRDARDPLPAPTDAPAGLGDGALEATIPVVENARDRPAVVDRIGARSTVVDALRRLATRRHMRRGIWLVVLSSSVAMAAGLWAGALGGRASTRGECAVDRPGPRARGGQRGLTGAGRRPDRRRPRGVGEGPGAGRGSSPAWRRRPRRRASSRASTAVARGSGSVLRSARRTDDRRCGDGVMLVIETANTTGAYRRATDPSAHDRRDPARPAYRADYRSEPITAGRASSRVGEREIVVVAVPADVFTRMAEARDSGGTLGPLAFRLTPGQLATVRAFRQRIGA